MACISSVQGGKCNFCSYFGTNVKLLQFGPVFSPIFNFHSDIGQNLHRFFGPLRSSSYRVASIRSDIMFISFFRVASGWVCNFTTLFYDCYRKVISDVRSFYVMFTSVDINRAIFLQRHTSVPICSLWSLPLFYWKKSKIYCESWVMWCLFKSRSDANFL